MTPILVCTVTGKSLPVLEASVKAYCPDAPLIAHHVERSTFGQSYNMAMERAFKEYNEIIIANDDIVLNPASYSLLMEDVNNLKIVHGQTLGVVASRSDYVRGIQDIKLNINPECFAAYSVSPLFAWISKQAFEKAKFPHTNWFSDDLLCMDLTTHGFVHYVSRSYIHHAGSQTMGHNYWEEHQKAIQWIEENRPDVAHRFRR